MPFQVVRYLDGNANNTDEEPLKRLVAWSHEFFESNSLQNVELKTVAKS